MTYESGDAAKAGIGCVRAAPKESRFLRGAAKTEFYALRRHTRKPELLDIDRSRRNIAVT
jgi:hypothetical protein